MLKHAILAAESGICLTRLAEKFNTAKAILLRSEMSKIIYAICAWGLGHSTRSLPIIRKLAAENHEVLVISTGRSLDLIRGEMGDACEYTDIPDYPAPKKADKVGVLVEGVAYIPLYINTIRHEMRALEKILARQKFDIIVSDNRYGMYSKEIPSFLITHQLRIMNPFRLKFLERGTETYNRFFLKDGRRRAVMVPDYRDDSLSGDLSHSLAKIDESKLDYVGPLPAFRKLPGVNEDIDVFFSVSGPEPHRTSLEKKILEQVDNVKGKIVLTLGKTESRQKRDIEGLGNVEVYNSLSGADRESMLNRSKLVVSRSGYSTLMDVAALGKKALFIPTPNQPEQEYLGAYHRERGNFHSVAQDGLDLAKDISAAMKLPGYRKEMDINKTVENVMRVIFSKETKVF